MELDTGNVRESHDWIMSDVISLICP